MIILDNTNTVNVGPSQLVIPVDYDSAGADCSLVRVRGSTRDELAASGIVDGGQYYIAHTQNWDTGVYQLQGVATLGGVFIDHTKIYTLRIK